MHIKQTAILVFSLILSSAVFFGCARPNFSSTWRDHAIVINGKYTDFGNATVYYDEGKKVTLNLYNDNDFLYICLISRNHKIESQLMDSGFLVWFDPDGGKKKVMGIRFPLGMKAMGMSLTEDQRSREDWESKEDQTGAEEEKDRAAARRRQRDFDKRLEAVEGLQEEMEIITGADKAGHIKLSLEAAAKQGIEAKTGRQNGYFVYELKVPLIKDSQHQYAIGTKKSRLIGLGMEMAGPDMGVPDKGMGRDKPSEEGDTPQRRSRGGAWMPEGFQLWATITLAR
jgi:hypothetical protein